MRCLKCGEVLQDDSEFCSNCGTPVRKEKRNCLKCGEPIEDDAVFCGKCGAQINPVDAKIIHIENKDKESKDKKIIALIIILSVVLVCLIVFISIYFIKNNQDYKKVIEDAEIQTLAPTVYPTENPTEIPQSTIAPPPQERHADASAENTSGRQDLYRSDLTYKRMSGIKNTVLVDDGIYYDMKTVIETFDNQCSDYMNGITDNVPSYLKYGSTAYNQQVEYKRKHPNYSQSFDSIRVINARVGGGYYYVWVTEDLNVTENGASKTTTSHWVYKIEKDNGWYYINDYTADPLF